MKIFRHIANFFGWFFCDLPRPAGTPSEGGRDSGVQELRSLEVQEFRSSECRSLEESSYLKRVMEDEGVKDLWTRSGLERGERINNIMRESVEGENVEGRSSGQPSPLSPPVEGKGGHKFNKELSYE